MIFSGVRSNTFARMLSVVNHALNMFVCQFAFHPIGKGVDISGSLTALPGGLAVLALSVRDVARANDQEALMRQLF